MPEETETLPSSNMVIPPVCIFRVRKFEFAAFKSSGEDRKAFLMQGVFTSAVFG